MEYRKKPVAVEAFQYDKDMIHNAPEWAFNALENGTMHFKNSEMFIKTLEGDHCVSVGDYIIKGVAGELYPCKPDIFRKTYELVGVDSMQIENHTGREGDSIGDPKGPTKLETLLLLPNSEMKLNILGTEYKITVKKYDENHGFRKFDNTPGYLVPAEKTITVCDMSTYPGWDGKNSESCICQTKTILRHQIVHAFLCESGLPADGNENEKLVHWFAIQGQKIFKAWQEAGAV